MEDRLGLVRSGNASVRRKPPTWRLQYRGRGEKMDWTQFSRVAPENMKAADLHNGRYLAASPRSSRGRASALVNGI